MELVVSGQYTGTSDTSQDVGTSTLEERLDTFGGNDLSSSVGDTVVMGLGTRSHHHSSSNSVQGVRSETSTSGDGPTEQEGSEERVGHVTGEEDRLERVVHTEVETSVDDDSDDGWEETSVETGETVRGKCLSVDVDQSVELSLSTTLGRGLGVVGKTSSGVVQRVDEEERRGTSGTTRGQVSRELLPVWVALWDLEEGLEEVLEGKVQGLGGEVSDDVGSVSSPEGGETFLLVGSAEAVTDTLVRRSQSTLLDHLVLVLDEKLDSLNGGSGSLGDGSGYTTHHEVGGEATQRLGTGLGGVSNCAHFVI